MHKVLVTGGTGYIGSHTVIELLQAGYEVVVYDNLSNSIISSLNSISKITSKKVDFIEGDIRDSQKLNEVFESYNFYAIMHFAGLKALGEAVQKPIAYYMNNVFGSLQLFQLMAKHNVKNIIFSSSATVYGKPVDLPLHEDMPLGDTTNPYGSTKLMVENILADIFSADHNWNIGRLRYFNPVGAHPSGLIGENPLGEPSNLMPIIDQVAIGKREYLSIFGGDYETEDGTGVRDYIHVVDLAKGHLAALERCLGKTGLSTINLGTGHGCSVLDLIKIYERVNGVEIPFKIIGRREGDVDECYADVSRASQFLGWKTELSLEDMCRDSWNWQIKNSY